MWTIDFSPRKVASISPSRTVKDSSKRRRTAPRRNVHIYKTIMAAGIGAGEEDGVSITDQSDVWQIFVGVGPRDLEATREVVVRDVHGTH